MTQAVVIFLPLRSVGVMADEPSLRLGGGLPAGETMDLMTARQVHLLHVAVQGAEVYAPVQAVVVAHHVLQQEGPVIQLHGGRSLRARFGPPTRKVIRILLHAASRWPVRPEGTVLSGMNLNERTGMYSQRCPGREYRLPANAP